VLTKKRFGLTSAFLPYRALALSLQEEKAREEERQRLEEERRVIDEERRIREEAERKANYRKNQLERKRMRLPSEPQDGILYFDS